MRRQASPDELIRLLEKQRKSSRTYSADESFPGVADVDLRYDLHVQVEQIYIHHHFLVFSSAAILHLGWKGVQTLTDIRDSATCFRPKAAMGTAILAVRVRLRVSQLFSRILHHFCWLHWSVYVGAQVTQVSQILLWSSAHFFLSDPCNERKRYFKLFFHVRNTRLI